MEKSTLVLTALLLVACLSEHGALAQTTHVVGDSLGWLVPPGGEAAYKTWADSKNFAVGDVLVFNFPTNAHDVAEVSKSSYDACNSNGPISISRNGPTNITLTSAGEHHFICTISMHCGLGQKLAINVSAAAAVAPAPANPGAQAPLPEREGAQAPAPTRSSAPATYVVGDAIGWNVPPGGPVAYRTWARGKRFVVGDILVFNFTSGAHDVVQVTRSEFDACNTSTTTTPPIMTTPARITLTSAGEHYYICTFPQHCSFGQKLAINVVGESSAGTPSGGPAVPGGPTSQPTTPLSPPPPPAGNSASAFSVVGALPLTFLAVVAAFAV